MPRKRPNITVTISGPPAIGKRFVGDYIIDTLRQRGLDVRDYGETKRGTVLKVGSLHMSGDGLPVWGKVEL